MKTPTTHLQPIGYATLCSALLVTGLLGACSSSNNDPMDADAGQGDSIDAGIDDLASEESGEGSMPSPTIELVPKESTTPANGNIYTDADGNALYTRYTDEPNDISCDSTCMQNWEPLTTTVTTQGISGNFDVVTRDDGSSQWTLLDYPLYLFRGDATAGELAGDNFEGQWALARPNPVQSGDMNSEEILVARGTTRADGISDTRIDRDNHTLYFFDNDTPGVSACTGGCASSWPPLFADRGAQPDGRTYSLITREDGSKQWAHDGRALYFWQGDNGPGEFSGADIPNWSVARP